jgi:hypothetical protein
MKEVRNGTQEAQERHKKESFLCLLCLLCSVPWLQECCDSGTGAVVAGTGGGSLGMTAQHTRYAIIPGIGGKMAAKSHKTRTSVTSRSKYRATPPQTPAIFPSRIRLRGRGSYIWPVGGCGPGLGVPHSEQKRAWSSSCRPQLLQYIFVSS